jgi:para-aminobenzoate synthetase component 1
LFSGSIGYVTPKGDFDFNVVIRSLFYEANKKMLSFKVGSGITIKSDPLLEYEECILKASAILQILNA